MNENYILSNYIDAAISQAIYDKLEDATFAGKIPSFDILPDLKVRGF